MEVSVSQNHSQYHYETGYNYQKGINNYRTVQSSNRFTKSHPKKRSIPIDMSSNSELWAGPTYYNSPPPCSLPIPRFSLKPELNSSSVDFFLNTNDFATENLRRILNLGVSN